jgi:hypothetical protein
MEQVGTGVGESKVDPSLAAIYLKLLEIEAVLAPLVPHIPAVVAMLDNPAARWRLRTRDRTRDRAQ